MSQSTTEFHLPLFPKIRALVVMDGKPDASHYASFGPGDPSTNPASGDDHFGLSTFIATLEKGGIFGAFSVTKAHRDSDIGHAADIETFRFDRHDLSQFDEIWLFGVAPPHATADPLASLPLSDAELGKLSSFMDAGGGVFATGDHENLGLVMNGRMPRVRSMRKW